MNEAFTPSDELVSVCQAHHTMGTGAFREGPTHVTNVRGQRQVSP